MVFIQGSLVNFHWSRPLALVELAEALLLSFY